MTLVEERNGLLCMSTWKQGQQDYCRYKEADLHVKSQKTLRDITCRTKPTEHGLRVQMWQGGSASCLRGQRSEHDMNTKEEENYDKELGQVHHA